MVVILQKPKKIIKQHLFASFDVETIISKDNVASFYFGSVSFQDRNMTFFEQKKMQRFILSLDGYSVVATNLQFDFFSLFPQNKGLYKNMDFVMHNSRLLAIRYKTQKADILFLDTLNYASFSVSKMGYIIKCRKFRSPSYMGDRKSRTKEEKAYFIKYNVRDAIISRKFMEKFQKITLSLGCELRLTSPASSLDLWKRKYYDQKNYPLVQPDLKSLENIRKAYYGGRTEAFKRGLFTTPYKLYDINSMYAFCMLNKFPRSDTLFIRHNPDTAELGKYPGVTYCSIRAPIDLIYPFLPFRNAANKLLFPLGVWKGWYSNLELSKALQLGYKIKPIKGYFYKKQYLPFKDFILDLYKRRLAEKDFNIVYKLFMNSLYGKFAQKYDEIDRIVPIEALTDALRKKVYKTDQWDIQDGFLIYPEKQKPSPHCNPIYSVYITAYARILLYDYIVRYKAIYCDTDSIITDQKIPESADLGKMKLETNIKRLLIIRPKTYHIIGKKEILKAKGVNRADRAAFENIIKGLPIPQWKFIKFKESIRRKMKINRKIDFFKVIGLEDEKRDWKGRSFDPLRNQESVPLIIMPKLKKGVKWGIE